MKETNGHVIHAAYWSINSTRPPVEIHIVTQANKNPILSFSALFTEEVMAPLKLHGSVVSTNTQRVLATLYEKEVEFELVNVNLGAGEHKQEPHISLNVSALLICKRKKHLFISHHK